MATAATAHCRRQVRVMAAIVHHSGRVLLVQRRGEARLRAPAGDVTPGEAPTDAIHRVARTLTGFAIAERGVVAIHTDVDHIVVAMRCAIRGIGSDFTSDTTGLHWCNAGDLNGLVDVWVARALQSALDSGPVRNGSLQRLAS